jgi:hypothetical protein
MQLVHSIMVGAKVHVSQITIVHRLNPHSEIEAYIYIQSLYSPLFLLLSWKLESTDSRSSILL